MSDFRGKILNRKDGESLLTNFIENYADAEWGRINVQMAVMFGKIKVSNIGSMMKFVEMFIPVKDLK